MFAMFCFTFCVCWAFSPLTPQHAALDTHRTLFLNRDVPACICMCICVCMFSSKYVWHYNFRTVCGFTQSVASL